MTYNSKKTIADMAAGIAVYIAYIFTALDRYRQAPDNLQMMAGTMLLFIGIGVAGVIVMQILFHIGYAIGVSIKESAFGDKPTDDNLIKRIIASAVVEDERDALIQRKSGVAGHVVAGIGFLACLITLALGGTAALAMNIAFGAFCLGSIIEGAVSIYLHERGVRNG